MKQLSKFVALSALLLLASSCRKDAPAPADNSRQIFEHLTQVWGFSPDRIEETPEAFIAEGDQLFEKNGFMEKYGTESDNEINLQATDQAADRKHRRHNYKVTKTKKIEVSVKSDVPQSWYLAVGNAIKEWNDLYGSVTFYITYDNTTNAKTGAINVRMSVTSGKVALTNFPTADGHPGKWFYINPNYNYLTAAEKKFTCAHELGHAIGFRHTDTYEGAEKIYTQIPMCDDQADPASVMRDKLVPWYQFSDCDIYAFYTLYP